MLCSAISRFSHPSPARAAIDYIISKTYLAALSAKDLAGRQLQSTKSGKTANTQGDGAQ